jgi:BolA family transcriptional regulator, general stress-responsive regulator
MNRVEQIRERLQTALAPSVLQISDDSHLHAGHEGAKSGGGHYSVKIVSSQFNGLAPLARHRLIYAALGELMQKEIHALAIQAHAEETNQ